MESVEIKPRYTVCKAEKKIVVIETLPVEVFDIQDIHIPLGQITLQQLPNLFDIDIAVMMQPPTQVPSQNRSHFYYLK